MLSSIVAVIVIARLSFEELKQQQELDFIIPKGIDSGFLLHYDSGDDFKFDSSGNGAERGRPNARTLDECQLVPSVSVSACFAFLFAAQFTDTTQYETCQTSVNCLSH